MHERKSNRKKIALIALCAALTVVLCGCGDQNKVTKQDPLADMITVASTMGDEGLNDDGWAGCEKASDKKDVDIRCLESSDKAALQDNLVTAGNDGASIAVVMGGSQQKAVEKAAVQFPDTNFLVVEGSISNDKNLGSICFHEEQSGFLAGVAAAMTTKKDKIGFLGLRSSDVTTKYRCGFTAGVQAVSPDKEVEAAYIQQQTDEDGAVAKASALKAAGCDIIMQAAGSAGKAVIEQADKEGYQVIGTDTDQSGLNSASVLCSAVKDVPDAVSESILDSVKGKFDASVQSMDLAHDGVALSDKAGNLSAKAADAVEKWKSSIEHKDITVPATAAELADFRVSEQ
ncbi:MAG: BMP family ABC transporter substrate-binding protein [Eubacteriales bacterium]|nr:BMP family ABC transporter substrate-binding protein [Eubacteriales bacterium]